VKQEYLQRDLNGTVVTTRVDGMPHRVLRTELVDHLEKSSRVRGFWTAARNAQRFKKMTGLSWNAIVREGLATKHGKEQSWAQMIMAANTPMLLRAGLVEGRTDAGVLASGQVVGMLDDLPSVAELIGQIVTEAEGILKRLPDLTR
jgi:NAD(P)H-dependent flavin oxidoreductase YrpB (nitropropane dioxygenase family)